MFKKDKNLLLDSFFDNIDGKKLDIHQRKIVLSSNNNILVVAGAGSGKTLTIIGKIKYLIDKLNYDPKEILCLSFTNETVNNLIAKVGYDINCFTFHKLSLEILNKANINYQIADDNLLEYLVDEYFESDIYYNNLESFVMDYLEINESYDILKTKYLSLFINYKKMIIKFIKMSKTNNHNYIDITNYLNRNDKLRKKLCNKNKSFLIIVLDIYNKYLNELHSTNSIDFDDMLKLAINIVNDHKIKLKYKYIIVDEFQDSSYLRYLLIKSIQDTTMAKLMCVGDDYQSIYGFSGCDIDLFVNFNRYFNDAKIMYLLNIYRNSYEIINTSVSFIKKNHYQLSKNLYANFSLYKPISIIYYNLENYQEKYLALLKYLYESGKKNVLVLGRYNFNLLNINYLDMEIRYMTVHCSKGLEEDNVILLDMEDKYLGFPNKIKDDQIFNLIKKSKDKYPYAEERRLFYVAITRTRGNIYIMTSQSNPSIFVKEIMNRTRQLIVK